MVSARACRSVSPLGRRDISTRTAGAACRERSRRAGIVTPTGTASQPQHTAPNGQLRGLRFMRCVIWPRNRLSRSASVRSWRDNAKWAAPPLGCAASGGRPGAPGQFPARAREVAGIAGRVALEIVLVFRLGLPEFAGGRDLRHNAAWPQSGGVDIVDCLECLVTLRLGDIENLRAVRSSDIVALAIQRGRIVNLEEELQEVAIADAFRIELDLDGLSVRSMVAVGRVRHIAARVTNTCADYAGQLADQVLHAPEATAGKHGTFKLACHHKSSVFPSTLKIGSRSP